MKTDWIPEHIRILEEAIDYHGRLDNRVLDDLADALGHSQQSIKAKVRQLRAKGKTPVDMPAEGASTVDMSTEGMRTEVKSTELSTKGRPRSAVLPEAISHVATPAAAVQEQQAKPKGAPPYTELVKGLQTLETLAADVNERQVRLEALSREFDDARRRMLEAHAQLAKRFPAAKHLFDRLIPSK